MAKISSLIDNTSDIIYPQTKANAVIMEDSSTVENAVNQRPKLVLSASEPTGVVPENTLYGVFGDVGQITTGEIADSAITTAKIASSAITDTKLATDAVTTDKIANASVTTAKIADGAITGVTNTATSVGSTKLALNTIGTPNLRDGAVTSDKIDWETIPTYRYFTNEQVVGKWVDGKTIYRRVWVFSGVGDINLGVRIHNIIHQSMIVRSSQDWHLRSVPWLYGAGAGVDGNWHAGFYITAPSSGNSYCRMQFGSSIGRVAGGHLILEYTKP